MVVLVYSPFAHLGGILWTTTACSCGAYELLPPAPASSGNEQSKGQARGIAQLSPDSRTSITPRQWISDPTVSAHYNRRIPRFVWRRTHPSVSGCSIRKQILRVDKMYEI
jgi:hypothetical protein